MENEQPFLNSPPCLGPPFKNGNRCNHWISCNKELFNRLMKYERLLHAKSESAKISAKFAIPVSDPYSSSI